MNYFLSLLLALPLVVLAESAEPPKTTEDQWGSRGLAPWSFLFPLFREALRSG